MIPVHKVCASGMAPAQVSPEVSVWVVLVEEMPNRPNLDQPVRLIHPILGGDEVIRWTEVISTRRSWTEGC